MKSKHKAGYRQPRTGEKRKTRQPFRVDAMKPAVREEILTARAEGCTWQETAERATKAAGEAIALSVCQRWYDVRVEQVQKEVLQRSDRARELAAAFAGKGFKDLPEAALNALSSEVFAVMEASTGPQREHSLGNLILALSKLTAARAKEKSEELEAKKVKLAEQKFEQLRAQADKATNDAATKLGKGRGLTIADINRIREPTLGLGPIEPKPAAGNPA